jgi:hypothetical protein
MPLGFRFAHAQLRQAQLQLARAFFVLQDQELKAERFLGLEYRRMSSAYFQIKAARAQRESFGTQLRVRYEKYRAGAQDATLDLLLEAQRFWADALATEYQAIVTYNNAICAWEYAKGTILQHDNVTISEGPIPVAAQKRAVEHMRERTKALVLLERAAPTGVLAQPLVQGGPVNVIPQINANSLPSVWKDAPPLKEAGELPPAEKINRETIDQLPPLVEDLPKEQVFPESELPGAGKSSSAQPPAPAPAIPTVRSPSAHSKTPARTTSTFGTLRPPDGSTPTPPATPLTNPVIPPANPAMPSTVAPAAPTQQPLLPLP